jgi:hypothetical protein
MSGWKRELDGGMTPSAANQHPFIPNSVANGVYIIPFLSRPGAGPSSQMTGGEQLPAGRVRGSVGSEHPLD